ncbi:GNAT family N-acetyltransferase [Pantoea sp. CTOTU50773]|uniref:GNAT family N-acetyltransferase n=1 Tax=Pantoea sp. CTOTU50773 TaxID=2953853 RepID=UPI0028AB4EFF|nr:GNAT family N-acetyltransferase [Pantoea sp. CTOTU50773]
MDNLSVEVSAVIEPEHLQPIDAGLSAFNMEIAGYNDHSPLSVVIRCNDSQKVLGGILGRTYLGMLFIDLVYLPSELRSKGLGEKLLIHAEEEGRNRGCISAFLYTISFQAPEFYKKHGWEEFGRIACLPEGASRIFMKKTL